MPVRLHSRNRGATLVCSHCKATLTTGQVHIGGIRAYAATQGWIRGLWKTSTAKRKANTKHDICPACAPAEREAADARRRAATERRNKRDENRKARDAVLSGAA